MIATLTAGRIGLLREVWGFVHVQRRQRSRLTSVSLQGIVVRAVSSLVGGHPRLGVGSREGAVKGGWDTPQAVRLDERLQDW